LRLIQHVEATSTIANRNERPEVFSIFPVNYSGQQVYNFIIRNNFIVWTGDDKFLSGIYSRALITYLAAGGSAPYNPMNNMLNQYPGHNNAEGNYDDDIGQGLV